MTVETLSELIETQKLQTSTIKELMEICTMLKDRVVSLEEVILTKEYQQEHCIEESEDEIKNK